LRREGDDRICCALWIKKNQIHTEEKDHETPKNIAVSRDGPVRACDCMRSGQSTGG